MDVLVRLAFLKPAQFFAHGIHPGRHWLRGRGHRSVRRAVDPITGESDAALGRSGTSVGLSVGTSDMPILDDP